MIKRDLHTHTTFCDGENTPEEMVSAAIDLGMETIGFSGHSYVDFDDCCMTKEGTEKYKAEVSSLKEKYKGQIEVLLGVEQDFYSGEPTDDYDYVIGSVHYLKIGDEYIMVDITAEILSEAADRLFGGDIYAVCEEYFNTVAKVAEKIKPDIIGHFDVISKFCEKNNLFDEKHPRYVAAWKKAADRLLKANIPFEINTGAISRGYKTTAYPNSDMIKYIKEKGGSFVLSSDSHKTESLMFKFSEYEHLKETENEQNQKAGTS